MRECPKCGKRSIRCKVNLFLDIDMRAYGSLNKGTLRTKLVRVDGADWPRALLYCDKENCGFILRMDKPAVRGDGSATEK